MPEGFVSGLLLAGIPGGIALLLLGVCMMRILRDQRVARAELTTEKRLRDMAEEALRQAQKVEAVGRLAGGIVHDFNNHLTVISSNVELLKRRLPDAAPSLTRLADTAMLGVSRAAALTQRLLAFSRQQSVDPEPLDAGQLVAGMLDLLRRTLGEGIVVKTTAASGLWQSWVDANQLESAILNLAVNARDAMPHGGILTIETANAELDEEAAARHGELPPGQYVMIAVHDTGLGMPPDVRARAFEPFFSTKPQGHGSGLGLPMVYGFVRHYGGNVVIDSETGRGTTTRLYLPRYRPPTPAVIMDSGPRVGEAETILVVEDDETVRATAVEALRDIGYEVLEAPDAMEAVRLLADRGGIDLLFTDIGLPGGVNGRTLADAARNINPALKVLFTTGYEQEVMLESELAGHDMHFLAKPFSLHQLGSMVRRALETPVGSSVVAVRTESA